MKWLSQTVADLLGVGSPNEVDALLRDADAAHIITAFLRGFVDAIVFFFQPKEVRFILLIIYSIHLCDFLPACTVALAIILHVLSNNRHRSAQNPASLAKEADTRAFLFVAFNHFPVSTISWGCRFQRSRLPL